MSFILTMKERATLFFSLLSTPQSLARFTLPPILISVELPITNRDHDDTHLESPTRDSIFFASITRP